MIYYDFFKDSTKINIKQKDENHLGKPAKEEMRTVLRVQGVQTDSFVV